MTDLDERCAKVFIPKFERLVYHSNNNKNAALSFLKKLEADEFHYIDNFDWRDCASVYAEAWEARQPEINELNQPYDGEDLEKMLRDALKETGR